MILEQKTKFAWDFIINRNDVDLLYHNNIIMFFAMLYIETNAMLTAFLMEGVLYGTLPFSSIPLTIYDFCLEYLISYPVMLILQQYTMGSSIKLNLVPIMSNFFYHKRVVEGW